VYGAEIRSVDFDIPAFFHLLFLVHCLIFPIFTEIILRNPRFFLPYCDAQAEKSPVYLSADFHRITASCLNFIAEC
jgi:hypothetical protein